MRTTGFPTSRLRRGRPRLHAIHARCRARLPPATVATRIVPRNTLVSVRPSRVTSTPNSVPRSVDHGGGSSDNEQGMEEGGRGIRDLLIWDLGFGILPPSLFRLPPCLHSRRQLAQREEAAGGGLDFIGAWALEDDLGPALVGDFHQAGGQGILAAQGTTAAATGAACGIGPAAIGHAGDPADVLRLRRDCFLRRRGRRTSTTAAASW